MVAKGEYVPGLKTGNILKILLTGLFVAGLGGCTAAVAGPVAGAIVWAVGGAVVLAALLGAAATPGKRFRMGGGIADSDES